jgi:hypothetical protein
VDPEQKPLLLEFRNSFLKTLLSHLGLGSQASSSALRARRTADSLIRKLKGYLKFTSQSSAPYQGQVLIPVSKRPVYRAGHLN